jgi:S-DNA-T family DNA segregation ATPase FtsK/SpoIIIE
LEPLVEPVALNVLMPDLGVDPGLGLVSEFWRGRGGFEVPVGVMDRPLEQRRETLVVSLSGAGGHFGVVGSARTGKSTFLRTLVVSLALTYTPVEVQFYVLDFGGGSFTPLRGLAHVAGVASRTDVESVRRVVAEVRSLLNDREMFFREAGIDSVETYRRRRALGEVDDGFGDVFLVVDGWGVLRSEFEELQDEVADIASRGLTYGVHLVVSALRWLDIRGVVKDLLGSRVELRLGDVAESVVGKGLAGNVPVSVPGRGLEMGGYHFLGALPRVDSCGDVGSLGDGVEGLVAAVNGAWLGPVGPKLRLLPECLLLSELRERVGVGCREVLLGLDEVGLAPVGFDPGVESCLFVYGDSGSGKSSLLRGFAHEVMRLYSSGEAQMFVVDYRRSLLGDISGEYLSGYVTGFDQAVEVFKALVGYCKRRLPGPDVTAEQLRDRSWWRGQEVFVLVDDYDLVATSQGNPLVPLVEVLTQAGDIGLHLVLARRSGGAGRASYDPVIQRLTDLGATGVLLSGNPDEGGLIGRVKPVWAVPGRARIVSRARGLYTAQLVYQPKLDTP